MIWHAIHIYTSGDQNTFLTQVYLPFCEKHLWPTRGVRSFFIRYHDHNGAHLRLRFKGEPEWIETVLKPEFEDKIAIFGNIKTVPYEGETERFGSPEALAWAEEHFHISTRVVLARLARPDWTYGDALLDGLKLHTSLSYAAGLSAHEAADYFDRLCNQWIKAFFTPAEDTTPDTLAPTVREDFERIAADQLTELRETLIQLYIALSEGKFDNKQPEWLRWQKGNEIVLSAPDSNKAQIMPHLIHLTNNRLGINNQDEAYLLYILGQALRMQ